MPVGADFDIGYCVRGWYVLDYCFGERQALFWDWLDGCSRGRASSHHLRLGLGSRVVSLLFLGLARSRLDRNMGSGFPEVGAHVLIFIGWRRIYSEGRPTGRERSRGSVRALEGRRKGVSDSKMGWC